MNVSVREVGRVSTGDVPGLLAWGGSPMWRWNGMLHFAVRLDTELQVFALDFDHGGLRRVAVFPAPWPRWKTARDAVAPDLSLAVFSGQEAIRAVTRVPQFVGTRT